MSFNAPLVPYYYGFVVLRLPADRGYLYTVFKDNLYLSRS